MVEGRHFKTSTFGNQAWESASEIKWCDSAHTPGVTRGLTFFGGGGGEKNNALGRGEDAFFYT